MKSAENLHVTTGNTEQSKSYWWECNSIDFLKAAWECVYLKLGTFGLTTPLLKVYPKEIIV